MKKKTRVSTPRRTEAKRSRPARAFIATANDALAAFLVIRGCRRTGITSERASGSRMVAAHSFEDEAEKLMFAVSAFQTAEDDDVPVGRFVATLAQLRAIRRDADFRLRGEAEDEIDRLRVLEADVRTWERKRR